METEALPSVARTERVAEPYETAAANWTSFIQDGNGAKVYYHLAAFSYSASGGDATEDNEEISFSVTGGTAVVFGVNLESYRWDEANM